MTHVTKRQWILGALGVLIIVVGALWYVHERNATPRFPLNTDDTIASWSFKVAYTGNETLLAQAAADTAKLTALLGKGEYDDYDLYIGIGNDAALVGDGQSSYRAYNTSIAIHPGKGLAYANLAHLMDQMGAYHTAANAYTKAVTVEPAQLEYHVERLTYLTRQFPTDTEQVRAALADADTQFGDTPAILAIEAQWLSAEKQYTEAIKVWQTVKMLSSKERQGAIDAEIARLKKKQ